MIPCRTIKGTLIKFEKYAKISRSDPKSYQQHGIHIHSSKTLAHSVRLPDGQ